MADLLREAPFGQLVRLLTRNKLFQYPEEKSDFQCPHDYKTDDTPESNRTGSVNRDEEANATKQEIDLEDGRSPRSPQSDVDLEKLADSSSGTSDLERSPTLGLQRTQTLPYTAERLSVEQHLAVERTKSRPIAPAKTADGIILADWYNTDDSANPQNWSQKKKFLVALQIDLYTFAVYCGSAIYVSSELGVMARFGVGPTKASLGLALYVLGYGLGPLLWSPMSEIPVFGRNVPYVATFAIYLFLCVPTALVNKLGGLLVLRFLQGFFGSPCLATGGASMQDMVI